MSGNDSERNELREMRQLLDSLVQRISRLEQQAGMEIVEATVVQAKPTRVQPPVLQELTETRSPPLPKRTESGGNPAA